MKFKIEGKTHESKKSHYIVEREHEKKEQNEITRLEKKIDKHIGLPMEKAHQSDQKDAPLPHMRKY